MCLKNKIITAVIGVCIAAFGIAGINTQTVQAQTPTTGISGTTATTPTIEQLEAIIKNLQQQIALVIELLQRRNLPICGNGSCEASKGETATSCPADCGQTGQMVSCATEGQSINTSGTKSCCTGLVAISGCENETGCVADSWTCKKPTTVCTMLLTGESCTKAGGKIINSDPAYCSCPALKINTSTSTSAGYSGTNTDTIPANNLR